MTFRRDALAGTHTNAYPLVYEPEVPTSDVRRVSTPETPRVAVARFLSDLLVMPERGD